MGDSLITAFVLAVVALSESVRRLSTGAVVLQRDANGPWRLARAFDLGRGLYVLAWLVPYALPIVISGPSDERLGSRRLLKRLESRNRRVKVSVALLRVNGAAVLTLMLALPFAVHRWGAWGFLVVITALLVLTVLQVIITRRALRRVGLGFRRALLSSLRFLSPFSAPQAAGLVQEQAVKGLAPLVVAHRLLGEDEFLRAIRPLAYDSVRADIPNEEGRTLLRLVDPARLRAFLARSPQTEIPARFCPRCATSYRADAFECADCLNVPLETAKLV